MRKKHFWQPAVVCMAVGLSVIFARSTPVCASVLSDNNYTVVQKGRRTYAVNKEAVFVKTTSDSAVITIPDTVELGGVAYKVTGIADRAFKGNQKLKKITIGKYVASIGKGAFNGCTSLKNIVVQSKTLTEIGDYALKNIQPAARLVVPKKKRSAYRALLQKAGQDNSVLVTDSIKKVVIDPGHQIKMDSGTEPIGPGAFERKTKNTVGAVGVYTKTPEYQLNLKVAKKLRRELKARGYEIVLTRTSNDVMLSNIERAKIANASGAEICIRIHADSMPSPGVRGASVSCPSARNPYAGHLSADSRRLCECLIQAYCSTTGIKNRGVIMRDDLTGTNWSEIPVCLVELGFLSNPSEDAMMQDADMQEQMARGLADGVDAYFWE